MCDYFYLFAWSLLYFVISCRHIVSSTQITVTDPYQNAYIGSDIIPIVVSLLLTPLRLYSMHSCIKVIPKCLPIRVIHRAVIVFDAMLHIVKST